jgi:hypothetical protein
MVRILQGFPSDNVLATVDLFGMLEVLVGRQESRGEPDDEKVGKLERWILGLKNEILNAARTTPTIALDSGPKTP